MLRLALLPLLLALLIVAASMLARRRRRLAGELRVDPMPAGLKHLASHVNAISGLGMGLALPRQGAARRRLVTLLGVR